MESLHDDTIARFGYLALPVLPGNRRGLSFDKPETTVTAGEAKRRWHISGWLTWPEPEARLELGVSVEPNRAWVRVERFPSVFLTPGVPRAIRAVYRAYHAHVSYAYLRVLRAQLER